MAINWNPEAGVTRTGNGGYSVLPENVIILPELSGRAEATDITELAHDISLNGQLEPGVCWKDQNGFPVLSAGNRRWRAITSVNSTRDEQSKMRFHFHAIPVKTEQEAFDYTVRENRNRMEPSPLDDAYNMHIYQTKFGLGLEQIVRKYYPGTSDEEMTKRVQWVKDTLKLLDLDETAKEALREGKMSTSAAVQLAQVPSRKKQAEVVAKAAQEGKKVQVDDAKIAKLESQGKTVNLANLSPKKQLDAFKELAELAGSLAAEILSEEPNPEIFMDEARSVLVQCRKLNIPLIPGWDKKADKYIAEDESGKKLVNDVKVVVEEPVLVG